MDIDKTWREGCATLGNAVHQLLLADGRPVTRENVLQLIHKPPPSLRERLRGLLGGCLSIEDIAENIVVILGALP